MDKWILKIVAAAAVLALYWWTLVARPVAIENAATGPGSLSVEQSRELLDESRALLRARDFAAARDLTRRLHDAYPQNHIYLLQLATIARELGDPAAEADWLDKYVMVSPTPIEACPRFGQAYEEAGRPKEALAAFERCLSFDPKDPDSLFWMAKAYESAGRIDDAEKLYARGLEVSPGYLDLRIGIGRMHLRQGRLAQARRDVDQVLTVAPDNVDALLLGGLVQRATGNYAEAKRLLEKGVARSPGYVDFYVVLGGIAESESRIADALRYYDKALELRPESRDVAARRARLGRS